MKRSFWGLGEGPEKKYDLVGEDWNCVEVKIEFRRREQKRRE